MTASGSASAPAPTPVVRKQITSHVGFSNLPNQVRRKSVKDGFQLTAMVVGESGLGKSTLINTLFNAPICAPRAPLHPAAERPKTTAIESVEAEIVENGVRLRLTVVDTPGFGDFVDNRGSWDAIVETIEQRFEAYLVQENGVTRSGRGKRVDTRVHACIYFIQPTGHSLKQIDIEFMRRLHEKVNLIPVIAKADTMTDDEISDFKDRIVSDLAFHDIHVFEAPTYADDYEEEEESAAIARAVPFAVVGASPNGVRSPSTGRIVRGRAYPWGVVDADDPTHCDTPLLRALLVRTHMEALRAHTADVLYEAWRTAHLLKLGVPQDASVFEEYDATERAREARLMHEAKLLKMESAMKEVFREKVEAQEAKLKQSEVELYKRHGEMKEALDRQWRELSEKKKRLLEAAAGGTVTEGRKKGTFRA